MVDSTKQEMSKNFFRVSASNFSKIPGSPIAYWVSENVRSVFIKNAIFESYATPRQGLGTTNNDLFTRFWPEVSFKKISFGCVDKQDALKSGGKWFPYSKGGGFRKWFGNEADILNWENDGEAIRKELKGKNPNIPRSEIHYFKEGITWGLITSASFSARFSSKGGIFDVGGSKAFPPSNAQLFFLGLLNSKITKLFLKTLNPTLNFQVGDLKRIPIIVDQFKIKIENIVKQMKSLSSNDWNSYEVSWDFQSLQLLSGNLKIEEIGRLKNEVEREIGDKISLLKTNLSLPKSNQYPLNKLISAAYKALCEYWKHIILEMQRLEEENNRIFIEVYGLQAELTPEVPLNEISILQSELEPSALKENNIVFKKDEILKQFISYAVGCIFGRYSLDKDGLILANAGGGIEDYLKQIPVPTFMPDESGILPITDENDFIDDLPSQFKTFLKASFGSEHFQENLRFVEESIGKDIRNYFIKDFYKDHVKRYKKRPIYWMISSPSGALRALIYLHRYTKDTISIFLNDYLRVYMRKLTAKIKLAEQTIISGSASISEKTTAQKNIDKFRKVLKELETWERDGVYPLAVKRVELDLDDGVKVNYGKLGDVLEMVKGLNA